MEEGRKKERIAGYAWSIVFHAVLVILFLFMALKTTPSEEEGILVNFGDSPTGTGASEPVRNEPVAQQTTPPPASTPAPSLPAPVSQPTPVKKEVMTQDYEETARINAEKKKKREAEQKKQAEERAQREEQARQKRIEEERKKAEETERQRKLAEERRIREEKEKQAQQARSNVTGAFSRTQGTGASEGETQGSGNQGYLTGDPNTTNRSGSGTGNSGNSGNSFSLNGRKLSGSLPKPNDNCNEAGIVVVEITVDKSGKITAANYLQRGTTNNSPCLISAAEKAAKKAQFNNDPNAAAYQKGTITYSFGFVKQ